MYAHCYRSGEIEISSENHIAGCLLIAEGTMDELETKLSARARHAYDGETYLVPGVPEANDDNQAFHAVDVFKKRMKRPLPKQD